MTCDICGHPKSSHRRTTVVWGTLTAVRRPCDCGLCPDYAPFQGYFGPPPTIEQESA